MRFVKITLAVVLLAVIGSAADGYDGIDGEFAPNVYINRPNAIGDIKGEFTPRLHRNSWNTIGDIKGEFVPNRGGDRPNTYDRGLTLSWFDVLDFLLGY